MTRSEPTKFSPARLAVAALLLAHVVAILALAACPRLHHLVHPDADDDDHDCAVVWLAHGGGGTVPVPVAVPVPVPAPAVEHQPAVAPAAFVPSIFAAARVFEHAPPPVG